MEFDIPISARISAMRRRQFRNQLLAVAMLSAVITCMGFVSILPSLQMPTSIESFFRG